MTKTSLPPIARITIGIIAAVAIGLFVSRGLRFAFGMGINLRTAIAVSVVAFSLYPFLWRSPGQNWLSFLRFALTTIVTGVVWFVCLSTVDYYFPD